MNKLLAAAKHLIARYLFELAPTFEGEAHWRRIWAIERQFGLVGYGEMLERQYLVTVARERVVRTRDLYGKTMDSDVMLHLQDAQDQLAALMRLQAAGMDHVHILDSKGRLTSASNGTGTVLFEAYSP